ncbi:MAG: hypothetical protein U1F40_00330 [Turneriella sp.]
MKKTMIMILALAMSPVALTAQAKKKTAAELAAERKAAIDKTAVDKRAATEQAAKDKEAALKKKGEDAQSSALAAADKALSSLSLMAWGGYNFTVKNDSTFQKNDTSSTYGGPSGGVHGYYGGKLQLGLSAAYITYANTPSTALSSATTVSIIPVEARVRYMLGDMFFVGAFAGYGAYLATPENTAGKPGFITSGLYAGLNYAISNDLSIALFCDARYLGSLNTELDNTVAKGNVLVTPAIGAYFKF